MNSLELIEPQSTVTPIDTTPPSMLALAVARGATPEQMERFMAINERWEANEARKAFNVAFAAFKAEAVRIVRTKEIKAGPLVGMKHAELSSIVDAATPALSRYGLSTAWKLTKDEPAWMEVTCTLSHVGGHSECVSMGGAPDTGPGRNAIQARGSTKTYLERYTLTAILGLAASDADDDGAGGGDPKTEDADLQAGRDAAMEGMKPLTAWWGGLTARQRGKWGDEFRNMRKAAARADEAAGHA